MDMPARPSLLHHIHCVASWVLTAESHIHHWSEPNVLLGLAILSTVTLSYGHLRAYRARRVKR